MSAKQLSAKADAPKPLWVELLRWSALTVFIAVPVFAFLVQPLAGRVVWTMAVAAVPLFIVLVGYHRWRRICPLAFFAQLPALIRMPGKLKAPRWLEANYHYVVVGIFFVSLWLRLIATNGDGRAIATFFIVLSVTAFLAGAVFTGKTWCNHLCPVSFIEKIYTEPHGLRGTENSQCVQCSACKKFCPDINEENGYWKELLSEPKRVAYFVFPGLVFGFYFYYYLQAGTWQYYFGGTWTNEPGLFRSAFFAGYDARTAGFFFWPAMPRAAAAAITLVFCAVVSLLLFSILERWIDRSLRRRQTVDAQRARHVAFSLAGFAAFVIFYSFAGQPSLRKIHILPATQLVTITVVAAAAIFLVRRIRRTPTDFAEETVARNIIQRWPLQEVQPPKDLREAFLLYKVHSAETARVSEQMLEIYEDAVRDALVDGFVTREEISRLENLRSKLEIKRSDHEKLMSTLALEERTLFDPSARQVTAEKRLQLQTYARALQRLMAENQVEAAGPDDVFVARLRREFGLTKEEHTAVIHELIEAEHGLEWQLTENLRTMARATYTIAVLNAAPSPARSLLAFVLSRRRSHALKNILRGLSFEDDPDSLRDTLFNAQGEWQERVDERLRQSLPQAAAQRLINTYRDAVAREHSLPSLTEVLMARLKSVDPYVRALALFALYENSAELRDLLDNLKNDEHNLVRETALELLHRATTAGHTSLLAVEKMINLHAIPIFGKIPVERLEELARAIREEHFSAGARVMVDAGFNGELLIMTAGELLVWSSAAEGAILRTTLRTGHAVNVDSLLSGATLEAGANGARLLRLKGEALRAGFQA